MGVGTLLRFFFPVLCGSLVLLLGLTTLSRTGDEPDSASRPVAARQHAALPDSGQREDFLYASILSNPKAQTTLTLVTIAGTLGWVVFLLHGNRHLRHLAQSERKRANRLAHRLEHDPLTGLINPSAFAERLRRALAGLKPGTTLAVLNIDFKTELPKPDRYGEAEEEKILLASSDLLRHALDTTEGWLDLARSSGKGFLVASCSDDRYGMTAPEIADRIRKLFLRPVQTESGSYLMTPAIGFASAKSRDASASELIRGAGLAVSHAIDNGSGAAVEYQMAMRSQVERRYMIENALGPAIRADEFLPHFQPQIDLRSGRIFGVEALARWYHPQFGWVSPVEFIPIAESNGDIVALGWKILESSCAQMRILPSDMILSVNLSVAQILNDDVVAMLDECLSRTGFPAQRLKLEVTETTVMSDLQRISSTLSEIRSRGVAISLDDFGVGYSALSYLTDFRWDEIKIDQSFAAKAVSNAELRDVLKLVIGIAGKMGSDLLIEGIETIEQRDILVEMGCTKGQGYLFGGPMAIDDISTLFFPKALPA